MKSIKLLSVCAFFALFLSGCDTCNWAHNQGSVFCGGSAFAEAEVEAETPEQI